MRQNKSCLISCCSNVFCMYLTMFHSNRLRPCPVWESEQKVKREALLLFQDSNMLQVKHVSCNFWRNWLQISSFITKVQMTWIHGDALTCPWFLTTSAHLAGHTGTRAHGHTCVAWGTTRVMGSGVTIRVLMWRGRWVGWGRGAKVLVSKAGRTGSCEQHGCISKYTYLNVTAEWGSKINTIQTFINSEGLQWNSSFYSKPQNSNHIKVSSQCISLEFTHFHLVHIFKHLSPPGKSPCAKLNKSYLRACLRSPSARKLNTRKMEGQSLREWSQSKFMRSKVKGSHGMCKYKIYNTQI